MLVRDCMTPNPITLRPGSDPLAGVSLCESGGFCRLPVVDENGQLVGIITEHDMRLFLSKAPSPGVMRRQHRVEQVMHAPVITVSPDCPVEEAAQLMITHDIGGLPVLGAEGRLVGIITRSDIFAQLAKMLGAETASLRLVVRVPDRPGELANLSGRIAATGANICSIVSWPESTGQMNLTLRVMGVDQAALLDAVRADPQVSVLHVWERETSRYSESPSHPQDQP